MAQESILSRSRLIAFEAMMAVVRIVIGWHFLYEGWTKLITPNWSAVGYLQSATGPLAGFFYWMSTSAGLMRVVDLLNIWGLLLVGLGLMLGVTIRVAAFGGIALLGFYYLAHPPGFGPVLSGITEGQYMVVNKTLVELFALSVLAVYPGTLFGLGTWVSKVWAAKRGKAPKGEEAESAVKPLVEALTATPSRRQVVYSLVGVPVFGAFLLAVLKKHGWKSFEEIQLRSASVKGHDKVVASATMKSFSYSTLRDLSGQVPHAKIGNVSFSRMILGGNLIGGWAHARDLIYVSKLVQAYHTKNKIFQTLDVAEACGINTLLTNPVLANLVNDYWRNGGKIQFISDCGFGDVVEMVQKSVDMGACSCYVQGGSADSLVEKGKFDTIAKAVELTRKNGLPAGIGAHKLATVQKCVEQGIRPDYWMKTLHPHSYWSAQHPKEHDNVWCEDPDETAAYMRDLPEPWIAFKTLGAGAINPKVGFKYAFEKGADFICVGMYDFQIVDDVNLFLKVFDPNLKRDRLWRA